MKYTVTKDYFTENNYTHIDPFYKTGIVLYFKKVENYVIWCDTRDSKISITKGLFKFNDIVLETELMNLTKQLKYKKKIPFKNILDGIFLS